MTVERWRQVEAVFNATSELPVEKRAQYLDRRCAGDPELRAEVESLLTVDGRAGGYLAAGIQRQAERLSVAVSATEIGKRIGPYHVTKMIGRGGMGSVYLATREDDVYEKPVALKLIRRGMDTDDVIERFRRERKILSRLDHPNIARLLDGGATDDGRPYLVMEYIAGTPLLQYARGLDRTGRLELFQRICAAVAFAHRNLVVHRDLKPGNILVTGGGAAPGTPRLLDFGIAKLLSNEDTSRTEMTVGLLTPEYASPEQCGGGRITTATDIYSLGRILEELLRDQPASSEIAQIVGKARHEDPSRRYATVEELSEDIRRFLSGLPVMARGDAPLYRARKFLWRNRWPASAALLAVLSLVLTAVVATVQARRAERRFQIAHGFANLMVKDLGRRLQRTPGALSIAHTLIGKTVEMLDALSNDAGNDRALQLNLGIGYFRVSNMQFSYDAPNFGEFDNSLENAGKARMILEGLLNAEPSNRDVQHHLGQAYTQIGWCNEVIGNYEESIEWFRKAGPLLEMSDPYPEPGYGSSQHLMTAGNIGSALIASGRCREGLSEQRYLPSARPGGYPSRLGIGGGLECIGDLEGAERQYTGNANDYVEFAYADLEGNPLRLNLGRWSDGLAHVRASVARAEAAMARNPEDMFAKVVMGRRYWSLGAYLSEKDPVESAASYERSLRLQEDWLSRSKRHRPGRMVYARMHAEMSAVLQNLNRFDDAAVHLREADKVENELRDPQGFTAMQWGDWLVNSGQRDRAIESYRRAESLLESAIQKRPEPMQSRRELADVYERLGAAYRSAGERDHAREFYGKSRDIWRHWTKWGVSSSYNVARERQAAFLAK